MRHTPIMVVLLCLGGLSILPGFGEEKSSHSVLKGVTALDKPVTYTETKIPLGDLVRRISRETGVPLTVTRQVADEPVAVAVKAFPAGKLLRQLGELLDFQWRRIGTEEIPRFEIGRDLASIQREEALRRALTVEVERRFQQELQQLLEVAALSQERLEAFVAEGDQRSRELVALPEGEQRRLRSTPENRALWERASRAGQVWAPQNRALANLLAALSPEQWNLLRMGEPITLSSAPQPGELPLPPAWLRAFRESEFQLRRPPGLDKPDPTGRGVTPEEWERREQEARERWRSATGYQVLLWLDTERANEALELYAGAYSLDAGGLAKGSTGGGNAYVEVRAGSFGSRQEEAEQERTPKREQLLAREPLLASRGVFQPNEPKDAEGRYRLLPEYLPEIARTFTVPMLSDAYTNSVSLWRSGSPEPVTLSALLDRLTGVHHRWDYAEGAVQLRHRAWFLERPREVPLRLVRKWQASCEQHGALHWADVVEAQRTLTPAQRMNMRELFPERHDLPADFSANGTRYAPLLYEALSPQQRARLRQRHPVAMAELTPAQRRLFLGPLRATIRYNLVNRLPPVSARDLTGATLTLRTERLLRTREVLPDGQVRYRTQTAPPGAVTESPRRYLVTRLRFQYQYTLERRSTEELTVAALS